MTFNRPIQAMQPNQPMRVINTIKPLKSITPPQLLQFSQQGQNQSDPFAINSLTDVLFNRRAHLRKFGDYNFTTQLKAGVHHLTQSYLKPILKADVISLGINSLRAFSEDADLMSNVTKGAIIEPDNEMLSYLVGGVAALTAGVATFATGGTFAAAIGAGIIAGGVSGVSATVIDDPEAAIRGIEKGSGLGRYGKTQYDFDMGNFALNMVGEVMFDPLNWLSFGSAAVVRTTTTTARLAGELTAEQAAKLTARNSMIHFVERLGALDDIVTKTAFLTNPLGLGLYGIKQASSPLLSAIGNKTVKAMADLVSKSDILDAQGFNEAISLGARHASGYISDVRKNYADELMIMPGKDAQISHWYRATARTLQKVYGVEFSKSMDMLDDMLASYLKGDADYLVKYLNDENKAFLEQAFKDFDGVAQTQFGAAKGYFNTNHKRGMDGVSTYLQRLNEGAQSRALFDESVDKAFVDLKKAINKNIGKKDPTVPEYLLGIRKGVYERFPELSKLPLEEATKKYEMLFKQLEVMYFAPLGVTLDDVFGKAAKLDTPEFLQRFAHEVSPMPSDIVKVVEDGKKALIDDGMFGRASKVEEVRSFLDADEEVGMKTMDKWFDSEVVPGFKKKLIWDEAKKVVYKGLNSPIAQTWSERISADRFQGIMSLARKLYQSSISEDPIIRKAGRGEVLELIKNNVVPEKVEYFEALIKSFGVMESAQRFIKSGKGFNEKQMDHFINMYRLASNVDYSDLKQYITGDVFHEIFEDINAIRANFGIIEETAIMLNKEGAFLLQLNKRFQTEFMRNTLLDSPAVELFYALTDSTQPLGMLMESLAKYNFTEEFAELGARAREVYTTIQGFKNYVELSTRLNEVVTRTVEYRPTEKIILDMKHAAWVVAEDDTQIVYRVLWDEKTMVPDKHEQYYTFLKEQNKDGNNSVVDMSSLVLITDRQLQNDLKELEALKAEYRSIKEVADMQGNVAPLVVKNFKDEKLNVLSTARKLELDDIFGEGFNHAENVKSVFKFTPPRENKPLLQYTHTTKNGNPTVRRIFDYVFNKDGKLGKGGLTVERTGENVYFNDLDTYLQFVRLEKALVGLDYNTESLAKMWVSYANDFQSKSAAADAFVRKRLARQFPNDIVLKELVLDDALYDDVQHQMLKHFTSSTEKMLTLSNYTDQELVKLLGMPESMYVEYVKPAKEFVASAFDGYSPAYVMKRVRDLSPDELDTLLHGGRVKGMPVEWMDFIRSRMSDATDAETFLNNLYTPPLIINVHKLVSYANIHKLTVDDLWTMVRRIYNDNPGGYSVILKNGAWSSYFGHPNGNYTPTFAEDLTERLTRFVYELEQNGVSTGVRLNDGGSINPSRLDELRHADIDNGTAIGARKIKGSEATNYKDATTAILRVLNQKPNELEDNRFIFKNIAYNSNDLVDKASDSLIALDTLTSGNFPLTDASARRIYLDTLNKAAEPIRGFGTLTGDSKEYSFLNNNFDGGKDVNVVIGDKKYRSAEAAYIAQQFHNIDINDGYRYTPTRIDDLPANTILVFPSTLQGDHSVGLAAKAKELWGAVEGQGRGLQGRTYAIPVRYYNDEGKLRSRTLIEISEDLDRIIEFANLQGSTQVMIPEIGSGLYNITDADMVKLFNSKKFPSNVILPYNYAYMRDSSIQYAPTSQFTFTSASEALMYGLDTVEDTTRANEIVNRINKVSGGWVRGKNIRSSYFGRVGATAQDISKISKRANFGKAYELASKAFGGKDFHDLPRATQFMHLKTIYDLLGEDLASPVRFATYNSTNTKFPGALKLIAQDQGIALFDLDNDAEYDKLLSLFDSLTADNAGKISYHPPGDVGTWNYKNTVAYKLQFMSPEEAREFVKAPHIQALKKGSFTNANTREAAELMTMRNVLEAKFKNPKLRERLLATGTRPLENAYPKGSTFWGTVDGEGKNYLGRILEDVRQEFLDQMKRETPEYQTAPHSVKRIISGGQTGADVGGLYAAKKLGLETGGTIPKGFKTDAGPRPEYAVNFNLIEDDSSDYIPRTKKNVDAADVTIAFRFGDSAGTDGTIRYAHTGNWRGHVAGQTQYKPYLIITTRNTEEASAQLDAFLRKYSPETINIAGHREKSFPGIEQYVQDVLTRTLGNKEGVPSPSKAIPEPIKQFVPSPMYAKEITPDSVKFARGAISVDTVDELLDPNSPKAVKGLIPGQFRFMTPEGNIVRSDLHETAGAIMDEVNGIKFNDALKKDYHFAYTKNGFISFSYGKYAKTLIIGSPLNQRQMDSLIKIYSPGGIDEGLQTIFVHPYDTDDVPSDMLDIQTYRTETGAIDLDRLFRDINAKFKGYEIPETPVVEETVQEVFEKAPAPEDSWIKSMGENSLSARAVLEDMSAEEYSLAKRKANGFVLKDGTARLFKKQGAYDTTAVPATIVKKPYVTDPENQELLYGMVLEMLEEFRTKPVSEAMELLANNGEKFYARFQLASHLAAYEDLMNEMYTLLKNYLLRQEKISDFPVKTIEMPSGEIGFQIQALLEEYLPSYVKSMNDEGLQQDMYTEGIEALKEQFFRFNAKDADGEFLTTSHRLAEAPRRIQMINRAAHQYFLRPLDKSTANRATATLMSTGQLFGAIGLEKSASPYFGAIQRYVNSAKKTFIEMYPERADEIASLEGDELRQFVYALAPEKYNQELGTLVNDRFQSILNTQAVYSNQLNAIGSMQQIRDTIQNRLLHTTGADVDILSPLETYLNEHTKMFTDGILKFNPNIKDALYNYQVRGTEMLTHTKTVLEQTVLDPKGTGFMGTYQGYTQAARNALSVITRLANYDDPESMRTLAQLLHFHSIGKRVIISKRLMPELDPRVLSVLDKEYGIKYLDKEMHVILDSRGATKVLTDLGPLKGSLERLSPKNVMSEKFENAMSAFYYSMQESATQTFPMHWSDAPIMRIDDAKIIPYLTGVLKYLNPDEAMEYAAAIQDSGMFGLSLLTDVDELSEVFGGALMESPARMAVSSGVSLMLHHDAKPRFLNLFFNEHFKLNNFFGTSDAKTIYGVLQSNKDLAVMGLNGQLNAHKIHIGSVKDVEFALKQGAIITTERGFVKVYNALDTFKMPKIMDFMERYLSAPFKAGAMTSLGLPFRNGIDNNWKLLMYAKGDLNSWSYIPKSYEYMHRFQEMALEMKNIQNPREVADYLLKQSQKDQEIFFLMVQAKELGVSGAPMDVYLDLSKAERMAAELRSGKKDPSSIIQKISWGNPLTQFALKLQNETEQHWRLAAYLYDMDRGLTASEISARVAEFFIDYSHKTPTMQYLNALMPFSMFTVKNTMLFAEHALDTPWLLRMMVDMGELSWRESQNEQNSSPSDYEKQQRMSGNIRLGNTLVKMNPSLYDAMMLIPGLIQNPLGRINPVIKNTAALMQGDMDQIQLPWETQAARAAKIFQKAPGLMQGEGHVASTLVPSLFGEMKQFDHRGTQYNSRSAKATFNSIYYAAQMSKKRGGSLNSSRARRNFYNNIWSASGKPRFASTTLQSRMNNISYNYRLINRRIY